MQSALWLWARREWRRRWGALALLTSIIVIAGGAAIGAVAAARRTDSAFDRLAHAMHLPDLTVSPASDEGFGELDPALLDTVAAIDGVTGVGEYTFVAASPAARLNFFTIAFSAQRGQAQTFVTIEGRSFDRWTDLASDEVVLNEAMAEAIGQHVGDVFDVATEPMAQWEKTINGEDAGPPSGPTIPVRVVTIGRVVEDVTDAKDPIMLVGPAFVAAYRDRVGMITGSVDVNVEPGAVDRVTAQVQQIYPSAEVRPREDFETRISDTVSLQRRAWLLIALTAALAGLLAMSQAGLRFARSLAEDDRARSALGFTTRDRRLGRFLTVAPTAVVGAVGASVVGYVLSRFAPVGVTRRAEPRPGLRWDTPAMAGGALVVLAVAAAALGVSAIAARAGTSRSNRAPNIGSPTFRLGAAFTAGPGTGAIIGTLLAVGGASGALTIQRSIDHLLVTPALYGADFDAGVFLTDGADRETVAASLTADPDIEALAVVWVAKPTQTDAVLVEGPGGSVEVRANALEDVKGVLTPTITRGRIPGRPDEVAVGQKLLAALGADVGDRLTVVGDRGPVELTVVSDNLDPQVDEAGLGFTLTLDGLSRLVPTAAGGIVARFAPGTDHDAILARHSAESLEPVRAPSEVGNVGQLGGLPAKVAALLVLLGVAALANSVVLTVRQGRRSLAIHRALGFTSGQVVRVHLWQGAATALAGVVLGGSIGLVAGRAIHRTLVEQVGAIAEAVWPAELVLVAIVVVVGCTTAAAVTAGLALRQRAGTALRTE